MLGADTLQVTSGTIGSDALDGRFRGSVSLATGAIRLDVDANVAASALPAPVRGVVAGRASLAGAAEPRCRGARRRRGAGTRIGPAFGNRQRRTRRRDAPGFRFGDDRRCRPFVARRFGGRRFRPRRQRRGGGAGSVAYRLQRSHPGGRPGDHRAAAHRGRESRPRQSGGRSLAVGQRRRREARGQRNARQRRRQALDRGSVADARTQPHLRRPRPRRRFPAARNRGFCVARSRSPGGARPGNGGGRPGRHDQLCRSRRQAAIVDRRENLGDRPGRHVGARPDHQRNGCRLPCFPCGFRQDPGKVGGFRSDDRPRHRRDADQGRLLDRIRWSCHDRRCAGPRDRQIPGRRLQDDGRARLRPGRRPRPPDCACPPHDRRRSTVAALLSTALRSASAAAPLPFRERPVPRSISTPGWRACRHRWPTASRRACRPADRSPARPAFRERHRIRPFAIRSTGRGPKRPRPARRAWARCA